MAIFIKCNKQNLFTNLLCACMLMLASCSSSDEDAVSVEMRISQADLLDKIKGGWAGQTIGVTYGWRTEFVYLGTYIQDYTPIPWHDDYVNEAMTTFPGLYDDVYVDLTFLEVFDRLGFDVPLDSFAS